MTPTLTAEEVELALDWEKLHLGGTIITMEQVELAERVLEFITDHPEQHNQWEWIHAGRDGDQAVMHIEPGDAGIQTAVDCGTSACFAGWTAVLDGHELSEGDFEVVVDGKDEVGNWAADRLGLPHLSSEPHPFQASNSLRALRIWVHAMRLRATMLEIAAKVRPAAVPVPDRVDQILAEDAWKRPMARGRRG
jgi:hypothetical protein